MVLRIHLYLPIRNLSVKIGICKVRSAEEFLCLAVESKTTHAAFDDNGTALLGHSDYECATLYSDPTKAIKSILICDNIVSSHIIW